MAEPISDPVMVALTEQASLRERYAHESEIGAFNVASCIYDKIHQRVMADMSANDGNMCSIESYCTCKDEHELYLSACRILKRFLGSHGVCPNADDESTES